MRHRMVKTGLVAATALLVAGVASTAYATPGRTTSCSSCHPVTTAIRVSATQTSNNGTTAGYQISFTGASGATAWAVLNAGTNVANGSGTSGNASLSVGKTYTIWGVGDGNGSNFINVTPSAPVTTPPPPPPPSGMTTSTLTIRSNTYSTYYGRYITISGTLKPFVSGDTVGVYIRSPRSTRMARVSTRGVSAITGAWSYKYPVKQRGRWYFQARYAGNATRYPAASPVIRVSVR